MNMPLVRAVIVMTIFSLIPSVGVSQWIESNSGLADSTIYAVFASGSKVFAGTDKGAYISVDNAVTWKALNTGLFIQPDSAIRAGDTVMVVLTTDCLNARSAPSLSGDTIYACEVAGSIGLVVGGPSKDIHGSSNDTFWRIAYSDGITGWSASVSLVKIGPPPPVYCFLGTTSSLLLGTNSGIFISTDNGSKWRISGSGLLDLRVTSLIDNGSHLLAGTTGGIYSSTNQGGSWTLLSLGGISISALSASGASIYAGTDSAGIFVSRDDGQSWGTVGEGVITDQVRSIADSAGVVVVGTSNAYVFYSTDGGGHWGHSYPSGLDPDQDGRQVEQLLISGGYTYAGTWRGVFLSSDCGKTWKSISGGDGGLNWIRVNTLTLSGSTMILGTQTRCVWKRPLTQILPQPNDWTRINSGLTDTSVTSLAECGAMLFAATSDSGVFRSTNDGDSWTKASTGLGTGSIQSLFAFGDTLFAAGATNCGVWRTTNSGQTWIASNAGLTGSHVNRFARMHADLLGVNETGNIFKLNGDSLWVPVASGNFYAFNSEYIYTCDYSTGFHISASSNEGATWLVGKCDLPSEAMLWTMSASEDELYLVLGSEDIGNSGIVTTTDNGNTFGWLSTGFADTYVQGMVVLGGFLFADTFSDGVFVSTDKGQNWACLGLPHPDYGSLAIQDKYLFRGSSQGVFRRSIAEFYPVPIQLSSMRVQALGNGMAKVTWRTQSETNNYGFKIQTSSDKNNWSTVGGLIRGHGTTLSPQDYSTTISVGPSVHWVRIIQIDLDGRTTYYDAQQMQESMPTSFALAQNYPNPFNPSTVIKYSLPVTTHTRIRVYNSIGQLVRTLVDAPEVAGSYEVHFDGTGLASGMYFYRMEAGSFVKTMKMLSIH